MAIITKDRFHLALGMLGGIMEGLKSNENVRADVYKLFKDEYDLILQHLDQRYGDEKQAQTQEQNNS